MVITLSDTNSKGGTKIYFPVNPEKIRYKSGTYFQEYDIIGKGPARIPAGEEISLIGWESFFPGSVLSDEPYVMKWENPSTLHKQLETWKEKGTKLTLSITESPFNMSVYIDTYEVTMQDAFCSLHYAIEFSKVVNIAVNTVPKEPNATSGTNRNSKTDKQEKYEVKKGDCLWDIAKKFYGTKNGSQWTKIYEANKTLIETTAKKYGKKNSNNGWWIYSGTILSIP